MSLPTLLLTFRVSFSGVSNQSFMNVNYKVYDLVSCAMNGIVASRVSAIDGDVYPSFVDPKSSTQADGAQSSRVPVPLPEDPYEAIRQAYLVGTDTDTPPVGYVEESEGSGTSSVGSTSSDSTTPLSPDHLLTRDIPVLVPSLRRTARMAVRVQPVLSPGYSAHIAEATSMSDVAFHKRFRSSYESSPSPSPTLLGDELGDEEVSLNSDSGSEDAEDEGTATGDEDPCLDDEGYGLDDESRGIDDEGHRIGLWGAKTLRVRSRGGSEWLPPTATIPVDEDQFIEVGAQLELYGSILQDIPRFDAMPPTLFADIDKYVRELYTRSGAVKDEIFSQRFLLEVVVMSLVNERNSEKEEKKSMEPESEGKKSKRLKRIAGSYATQKSPKKPKVMKSVKNVTEEEAAEYKKEKEELRVDESSSYHGDMQAFLRRLDRQDLNDLYRCGVHTLLMDGTPMEINMLVEKKYPLIKELLKKMLNLQLEAEEESTMAFELIKFIKSMLEE
ncbi:hypothetical protein Tco_0411605 [Tanacetum coccineum]